VSEPLRVRGTLLPGGHETELWIVDGRFRFEGPSTAAELAPPGGFLLSGLVDCHSHISWPHERDTPAHTSQFMDENRRVYAGTGVTLLRDMGSHADAVLSLAPRPGLPRVQAAGTLLLRHEPWPFTPTPPERLRRAALAQIAAGAAWVKIFSDWSSDYSGRENTAFSAQDELTYPLEVLAETTAAVHAAGGRVAAHCFTRVGTEASVEAGVDSLEHGWGVDEAVLDEMAKRRIAWAPLLGIALPMWETAVRYDEKERAAWIEGAMDALHRLLPEAERRGVQLLTGTDWHPQVTVVHEMRELQSFGVPRQAALAAATWGARAFLDEPGVADGAPADLLVLSRDPREDLDTLEAPAAIVIGGALVEPDLRQLQRGRVGWDAARRSNRATLRRD
jgi:imidazolonepropionase-like amidohydrolase